MRDITIIALITVILLIGVIVLIVFVLKKCKYSKQLTREKNNKLQQTRLNNFDIISGERLLKLVQDEHCILNGKYERVMDLLRNNKSISKYVVTHQSDTTISNLDLQKYTNVKHWFGCNVIFKSSQLTCLPLGIADSHWPHGDINTLCNIINENNIKDKLCYLNIKVSTNVSHRRPVQNIFSRFTWVSHGKRTDYENYLRDLSKHKYALAPEGNGPDTHRAWECLYLGVIPIIKSSIHQKICFEGLPILVINNWKDVTKEKLVNSYIKPNPHKIQKLRLEYWKKHIYSIIKQEKNK